MSTLLDDLKRLRDVADEELTVQNAAMEVPYRDKHEEPFRQVLRDHADEFIALVGAAEEFMPFGKVLRPFLRNRP